MVEQSRPRAGVIALFVKVVPKMVSVLAKILRSVKVTKVGLAAASFGGYATVYTWEFALMLMSMLFIHESGHIWAMKRCGIKTKGIYFLPFVGGAAVAESDFPSRNAEVYVAIAGPIAGLIISMLTGLLYPITLNPTFAAAAGWMAVINLFNLLPINPLDGGRIFKSIAFSINTRLGLMLMSLMMATMIAGSVYVGFGLFTFLAIVGGLELVFEYKRRRMSHPPMTPKTILLALAGYLAVSGMLWWVTIEMQHVPGADHAMELLKG